MATEQKAAADFARQGYGASIELWTQNGYSPRPTECQGRWMKEGDDRSSHIGGWNKARAEAAQ